MGRLWPKLLVLLLLALLVGYGFARQTLGPQAQAGTAYGAHNACSCRYIAGRDLGSCKSDFIPGMWSVMLSDDEDEKSVTAYVPLIASNTATYRSGYGCVLEEWER